MVWLACQPPEGRGKDGPAGLGMTLQDAIKHTPQQLEFALAGHDEIKGMSRILAADQNKADRKTTANIKSELEEHRRRKREYFLGNGKSPLE